MPDYRFRWNGYKHPALVAAFTGVRTPGGLIKNMTGNAAYDGTLNGTYTPANPLIRAKNTPSLDFDGAAGAGGNYISLANPISGLTNFSIAFWSNGDTNLGVMFSRAASSNLYLCNTGTPQFAFICTIGNINFYQQKPVIGRTYMVVVTHDNTDQKMYVPTVGGMVNRIAPGVNPVDANAFIGQYWDASLRLNGRLDNIMFWSVTLTPDQINSIYRSANPRL